MPPTLQPKAAEKHLIFVKNIPTYMARSTIPALYNEYGAFNVKNVYPESSITTAVVSFRTKDEAARAQEETDGMRLNDVILRVEMYERHRSVRFLRGNGQANRPLSVTEEEDSAGSQEEVPYDTNTAYTSPPKLVMPGLPDNAPGGTTWARIAAIKSARITKIPPNEPEAHPPEDPATASSTPAATPRIKVAVPHITFPPGPAHPSPHPPKASPDQPHYPDSAAVLSSPTNTGGTQYETELGVDRELNKLLDTMSLAGDVRQNVAAWEPIDTTELIRWRHCQGCYFCKLRMRSPDTLNER